MQVDEGGDTSSSNEILTSLSTVIEAAEQLSNQSAMLSVGKYGVSAPNEAVRGEKQAHLPRSEAVADFELMCMFVEHALVDGVGDFKEQWARGPGSPLVVCPGSISAQHGATWQVRQKIYDLVEQRLAPHRPRV